MKLDKVGIVLLLVASMVVGCSLVSTPDAYVKDASGKIITGPQAAALIAASVEQGEYTVVRFSDTERTTRVKIGDGTNPPAPPGPKPDPSPSPDVKPQPVPIKEAGIRVLIVEETEERDSLPVDQRLIFSSVKLEQWADDHCEKVNGRAELRKYDKDADLDGESSYWKAAMKLPRESVPWLYVSNGVDRSDSMPLPETIDELMEILKRYE